MKKLQKNLVTVMPQKQIIFAKSIDSSDSSHGCSPISGVTLKSLSMRKETRSEITVNANPKQQYRQIGILTNEGVDIAVVVQKQEGSIVKKYGSYQLLFNGAPDKRQNRAAQDYLRKLL